MNTNLKQLSADRTYGRGTSKAAQKRKARNTVTLHVDHTHGALVTMSGGRQYRVAKDGSFRRLEA